MDADIEHNQDPLPHDALHILDDDPADVERRHAGRWTLAHVVLLVILLALLAALLVFVLIPAADLLLNPPPPPPLPPPVMI